ncbi:hypothetical protein BVX98_01555 [bacterium F11]|nr:hypothetical protein BVX98_01555 [bacterium F11]
MGSKLLFVDDEESIHKILRRVFEGQSYSLLDAYNGEDAIKVAEKEVPDLILLDINMPKMDGYDVIRELRKNKTTRNIPILMLTGNGDVVDKVVGYELGVEDYVTKPFHTDHIRLHVESLL